MPVVPHSFLFRFQLPVQYVESIPLRGQKLLDLPEGCTLPELGELDDTPHFARLRAGWNENGLGFSVDVAGKRTPLTARPEAPAESDGLQIWIDTRNTQSIHRASRFCHHFCVLPVGGGKKSDAPLAVQLPIARGSENAEMAESKQLPVAVERRKDGYRLEVWLPAELLHGYDAQASPLLGFYYVVRDSELGEQFLTVGRDFPFAHDPSLWSTLELRRRS
jgi:hypothetical protein